jgi:hypothetical protein
MHKPILALMLLGMAGPVQAGLTGDTVKVEYLIPDESTLFKAVDVVVDGGVEVTGAGFGLLSLPWTLDFSDFTISFRQGPLDGDGQYNVAEFNGWRLSSLDFGVPISSVELTSFGIDGLDSSRLVVDGSSVLLNLQGLPVSALNGWDLRFIVEEVAEPASLLLLGLGLLLLRTAMTNRRGAHFPGDRQPPGAILS